MSECEIQTATFVPLDDAALDELRQIARDSHARGELAEAIDLQRKVMTSAEPDPAGPLFMALLSFAVPDLTEGIQVLRAGIARFPDEPALHENLGVCLLAAGHAGDAASACQIALKLGSISPNVYDCLCEAHYQLGRLDEAEAAGRAALAAKDAMFGGRDPVAAIPSGPPPAFNPLSPAENVISYVLWGNEPRYTVPLAENVRILPHLFPGWTIRIYYDATVDHNYITALGHQGAQLRQMILPPGQPGYRRLLWRFEVIRDPSVRRFLIRDADSLLSVKERVAVDAWLQSRFFFHTMRDYHTHTDLILAGMWGGIGNILPSPSALYRARTGWRMENDHIDQDILAETVWSTIRPALLIHDSVFTGALGSVPFPPYGNLPAGSHIGQNAFVHFNQSG